MPSISTNTAWALCSYVDSGGSVPSGWSSVFTPTSSNGGNYAAVFQYTDGTYALVIQGTKNFLDSKEDLDVETQVAFQYVTGAQISNGSNTGMGNVLGLVNSSNTPLGTFLKKLPANSQLLITGHSLGGNLASVFAPWVAANVTAFGGTSPVSQLPSSIQAITFAAPTAGNAALATFLNNQSNYQAYFNSNDVVPHVWGTAEPLNAYDIQNLYSSQGGPACPSYVWNMISNKLSAIKQNGYEYAQTNGTFFKGPIQTGSGETWLDEMSYQHNTAYANQYGS